MEVSNLMRTIALHNAMLIHQHHSHRMDLPPNAPQAQQPQPLRTYTTLLVRPHSHHPSFPQNALTGVQSWGFLMLKYEFWCAHIRIT